MVPRIRTESIHMNFISFLLIIRSRLKIFLTTFLVIVIGTIVVNLLLPKTYKATSTLVLNIKGVDPITGMSLPAQLMPGFMPTQVDIVSSMNVAGKVVDDLKLTEGEEIRKKFQREAHGEGLIRDWMSGLLLRNLEAIPSRESNVLDISFKAADPQFAATVANAFATEYRLTSIQLKVEPAKEAANYINEQIKVLREKLEVAQNNLSKFQQDHGMVTSDARIDGLDVESARLNELSAQLVNAQSQLFEATSRHNQASGSDGNDSPDVMNNSLIQNLKASLATAESKFAEVADRLDVNHPQYQSSKAEVDKLRADLDTQLKATSRSIGSSERIYQQREAEIRTALATQKARVLEMNRVRDDLRLLRNEVDSAQRAYDAASQRYTATNLEGQSNLAEIAVLNPAVPPNIPYGPKTLLNTILAIFVGGFFGVLFSVATELRDRRVRSVDDVALATTYPVLADMDWRPVTGAKSTFAKWTFARRDKAIVTGH